MEQINLKNTVQLGYTYSPRYAKSLGINPKETFITSLDDLKPKAVRLMAYWDEIEKKQDLYDFSGLDWYINQASVRKVSVVLAVGYKLPRWPECFAPSWVDQKNIPDRQAKQLKMVGDVITSYTKNPTVTAFQIENEPMLQFGVCPPPDPNFLKKEIEYVKNITQKPIVVTDTGELQPWKTPIQLADIFGTTLYRTVNSPELGELKYPLPPLFYSLKSQIIHLLFAPSKQTVIIAELQTEGWYNKAINEVDPEIQVQQFPPKIILNNVNYARKTGFNQIWLWGVEWWYYLKMHGHPEYVNTAKELFETLN